MGLKSPLQMVTQHIIILKTFKYHHPDQAVQSNRESLFSKSLQGKFTRKVLKNLIPFINSLLFLAMFIMFLLTMKPKRFNSCILYSEITV